MELMQFFESTIMTDSTLHAAHLISVPRRSFLAYDKTVDSEKIIRGLGLQTLAPVTTSKLASSLSILLSERSQFKNRFWCNHSQLQDLRK